MEIIQLEDIIEILETNLPSLQKQYHLKSIGVFGSFVKGKQTRGSDLDILVSFVEVPGLLTFVELENRLGELLGVKVDLVMEDALKPKIGEQILREVVRLYG